MLLPMIEHSYLIALSVTPPDEQERARVDSLCQRVQEATGGAVKLASGGSSQHI